MALRRYLIDNGMGALPPWYPLIRAARYLGVPPWDLMAQAAIWQTWAITAEGAENEAQEALNQQHAAA